MRLKTVTRKRRTMDWKPRVVERTETGLLTFTDDQHRPGLFAFGKRHDYHIAIYNGLGCVGRWSEGELYDGEVEPGRSLRYATVPNATTNQLIRLAEEWESGQ